MLENSTRFLLLALALGRIGAIYVPVNLALKGDSLLHVLRQSGVSFLAVESSLLGRFASVARSLPELSTVLVTDLSDTGAPRDLDVDVLDFDVAVVAAPDMAVRLAASAAATFDPWCVMFTSGTTGPAKGAVMTHQYWYVVPSTLCGPARDVRPDDVFYVSSPMFHAAAWLVQIVPSLILGLPVAIDARFSASQFWDRVRHYGATQLLTMGATHIWLWNQDSSEIDADNPARVWAPVPLPGELYEPFKKRFGIEHLWSTYGGTEFMSVTCTDVRRAMKPGASGRARPSVELAVLDDRGRRVPAGVVGELCVRPIVPHAIFQGYFGMPEETLSRFGDLWYHTGDLVRIDEDDDLFFVDRKDDYLRVRGENVSSFDVETAFNKHPAVAEAAVFSVPSEESSLVSEDEIMVALVQSEGANVELTELLAFVGEQLPHFAVPRYLEFLKDLPRTPTGRVQKHILRNRRLTPQTFDRIGAGIHIER
jgi:crotonobetaine/carnitine-CoA ligase